MLLSFIASLHWAREESWVKKIAAFVLLVSFFSAFLGGLAFVVFGPLPFLSFPFYERLDEGRLRLAPPYSFSNWLDTGEIRFFSIAVLQLVPQGPIKEGIGAGEAIVGVDGFRVILLNWEIGSVPLAMFFPFVFLLFVSVNAAGALLGLAAGNVNACPEALRSSKSLLVELAIGLFILTAGLWLLVTAPQTSSPNPYYISYDPHTYFYDAFAAITFGITWLSINIAVWIRSRILLQQ